MRNNVPLKIYPLSILHEGEDVMVGRIDKDSYAQFPEDAVALLLQLQQGMSPDQAAIWYEQQYAEAVDMDDFLKTLVDFQFILDEGAQDSVDAKKPSVFFQSVGKLIFSLPAWIIYGTLLVLCAYGMFRFPVLIPHGQNLFFSSSLTLIEMALLIFQVLAVLFHEIYHSLAGQRLGLPTRITVGHRLGVVTLETSLTSLWTVPRRSRYLPLLAGMLADTLVFSGCILIAWLTMPSIKTVSPLGNFCLAMAYATLFRFLWQFSFYLRTDLYYVITTALRCIDLQQTTRSYLKNILYIIFKQNAKIIDENQWHPRDRQVARWYLPLYLGGYAISIGFLFFVAGPLTIQFISMTLIHLSQDSGRDPVAFFDALFFLMLNLLPWIVLTISSIRKVVKWKNQRQNKTISTQAAL